ncbi:hypothetical protein [Photobacterium leiognathi]|uniref:hypothetical protein n=1 Tax=Photobacterium leiognathi TaxID=553611 RepID=UPI002734182A|nr:hypothetical protein [Photobacterium leiognathi]
MQIINLKIQDNNEIIREIVFKDGVNIITNDGDDGNQIGKSTVLKIINFFFGGKFTDLWHDPLNKSTNETVKEYLTSGNVKLILKINVNNVEHTIVRTLYQKGKRFSSINSINGLSFDGEDKYKKKLIELFGYANKGLSFSQLKNRFFEVEKKSSCDVLGFLYSNKKDLLTQAYSYLYSSNSLPYIIELNEFKLNKKELRKELEFLLKGSDISDFKNRYDEIQEKIESYEYKINSFDISKHQLDIVDELKSLRIEIASNSENLVVLENRAIYNNKTIENYNNKIDNVDVDVIESIYKDIVDFFGKPKEL